MARERMVTRTVFETVVDVMVVNTENAQVEIVNKKLTFQPDTNTALKYLQKHFDTETFKHVSIQGFKQEETLYGMTEQEFIQLAKVLPPRSIPKIYQD